MSGTVEILVAACSGSMRLSGEIGLPLVHVDAVRGCAEATAALRAAEHASGVRMPALFQPIDFHGGWDDWGTVDVDHLTLSFRSRLSTELSYAITTFTLLSTMRGQTQGSGFPIFQCGELFEEVLDLVEGLAFDGPESPPDHSTSQDIHPVFTNRQLVNIVLESQIQLLC